MSKFKKFKKREPNMDSAERATWDKIQALYVKLGFENSASNTVDIMYARDPKELLWELERFARKEIVYPAKGSKPAYRTGLMNLDPIGMS